MLHSLLWTGLKPSLKDISGQKYDAIKDFDALRVALRQVENDHLERQHPPITKTHPAKAPAEAESQSQQKSDMEEVKGLIKQLSSRMDTWEEDKEKERPYNRQCIYRNQPHRQRWQNKPQQYQTLQDAPSSGNRRVVKCYRCGQTGHIKKGCRVPAEDIKPLNSQKPMGKGHH